MHRSAASRAWAKVRRRLSKSPVTQGPDGCRRRSWRVEPVEMGHEPDHVDLHRGNRGSPPLPTARNGPHRPPRAPLWRGPGTSRRRARRRRACRRSVKARPGRPGIGPGPGQHGARFLARRAGRRGPGSGVGHPELPERAWSANPGVPIEMGELPDQEPVRVIGRGRVQADDAGTVGREPLAQDRRPGVPDPAPEGPRGDVPEGDLARASAPSRPGSGRQD